MGDRVRAVEIRCVIEPILVRYHRFYPQYRSLYCRNHPRCYQVENEAADAIGMSYSQKLRRIIFPRAFGIMLPAYGNEVIFMLKGSALASTITLMDITGVATTIMSKTYTVFELFFASGIIYLLLSWLLIGMFRLAEKRINRHLSYQPISNGSVTA